MTSRVVKIRWLKENESDIVSSNRIVAKKNKGVILEAGSIVNVKYKSGFYNLNGSVQKTILLHLNHVNDQNISIQ